MTSRGFTRTADTLETMLLGLLCFAVELAVGIAEHLENHRNRSCP